MKKLMIAAVLSGALTCAADSSYTYTAGDTGSGAVAITYDEGTTNIKTLTANTAGDTVSITGDAMTFADGATITLASSGTVSFAQKVTTLGATTLTRGDNAYTVWKWSSPLTETLTTSGAGVFSGLSRDDYVDSSIVVVGDDGPCPGRFTYVAGPNSGIYTLNMVRPDYTYSIRAQLNQSDGKIVSVRCVTGSRSPQFAEYPTTDLWGNKSCSHYCTDKAASDAKVTKIGSTSALKLKKIIIRKKGMAETVWVRFDGGVALGGTTSVGAGVEAVIGASEGNGAVTFAYPITGDGDVRIATLAASAGATSRGVATLNSSMNAMFGSTLTFDGRNGPLSVTVNTTNAFPVCGVVNVCTNADVSLRATGLGLTVGISGGTSKITVQPGGALRRLGNYNGQIGVNQDVVVDGGTYETSGYNVYQRFLTLMNGAHTTGSSPPRTVYSYTPQNWKVRGSSPSFIDNGINIFGGTNETQGVSRRFRFDVADVTGGAAGDDVVDCTVAKIFHNDDQKRFSYFRFEKLGAGTMLLNGTALEVKLETFVSGGTFILGKSGIATNAFVLCGGNLAAAAGTSNNLGALTVSNACTIAVGDGGSLSFKSFTRGPALAEKSIIIDAPQNGNVVKFNSNVTDNLSYFRWKDDTAPNGSWRVSQDAEGYLHPLVAGAIIYIL